MGEYKEYEKMLAGRKLKAKLDAERRSMALAQSA
jgi:hypothetical protein